MVNRPFTIDHSPFTIHVQGYFSHPTAVIDEGSRIGDGTRIWHFSHIMAGCEIGNDCNIGQNVVVSPGVVLGNNVKVQNNVSIYTGVVCEDDVFLGPSCVFTNVLNPRSAVSRRDQYVQTLVKKGATIGANATILCGVEIGEYAFVGAGAVVTKSLPAYALVTGNPARQTGWMSEHGCKLLFDAAGKATCAESAQTYQLDNGRVIKVSNG
jgi:UDP-2-acetamido-3-amino-2,3-dideoxy-glucuronate N-acetyltransferase